MEVPSQSQQNGEENSKNKNKKIMVHTINGESSSENVKEKIMVHTINVEDGGFVYGEFITINLSNKEIKELPYVLVGGDHGLNSMISIGSTLYVVGGLDLDDGKKAAIKPPNSSTDNKTGILYHHGMSFIDLDSNTPPNSGWKSAPCNRDTPDYYTAAVSLGGKIYSFARSDYAGIFDPVSQKWETLLPPPEAGLFYIDSRTEIIADPDNNRLLVFFRQPIGAYFAYYPTDNRWERNANTSSLPWSRRPILIADDGLFFIYLPKQPNVFKVYDSVAQEWLNVGFTVPFSMWRYKFQSMVYLGNDLICLLAKFPTHDANDDYVDSITLCKFRFVRSPTELLFTSFPDETYTLTPRFCKTVDFLPI